MGGWTQRKKGYNNLLNMAWMAIVRITWFDRERVGVQPHVHTPHMVNSKSKEDFVYTVYATDSNIFYKHFLLQFFLWKLIGL